LALLMSFVGGYFLQKTDGHTCHDIWPALALDLSIVFSFILIYFP
jgi:hypothetical protein